MATSSMKVTFSDLCGVCEKPGTSHYWPSHTSCCAHPECIEKIKAVEEKMIQTLTEIVNSSSIQTISFGKLKVKKMSEDEKNGAIHLAHAAATVAVKRLICNTSFSQYIDDKGSADLQNLFTTTGTKAGVEYLINSGTLERCK